MTMYMHASNTIAVSHPSFPYGDMRGLSEHAYSRPMTDVASATQLETANQNFISLVVHIFVFPPRWACRGGHLAKEKKAARQETPVSFPAPTPCKSTPIDHRVPGQGNVIYPDHFRPKPTLELSELTVVGRTSDRVIKSATVLLIPIPHLRHPTFQITCTMSLAVLTVLTTFPTSPEEAKLWSSSSASPSSYGINMPDDVRRNPSRCTSSES